MGALRAAIEGPEAFLASLKKADGRMELAVLRANLRLVLEPDVVKMGLESSDLQHVLESMTTVEELREALAHPYEFFERAASGAADAALALLRARLRPKLDAHLASKNLQMSWEQMGPWIASLDEERLKAAIAEPSTLFEGEGAVLTDPNSPEGRHRCVGSESFRAGHTLARRRVLMAAGAFWIGRACPR